jgi:ligand-binding sensor domain-containing protein
VRAIAQENDSTYWIGTDYGGLAKFDGNNWTVFNTANSGLPHNDVRGIVIDGHNKWIGTIGGGLAKFNDTTWTIYNSSNSGLPHDNILSVTMDAGGNLWIGTTWVWSSLPPGALGGAVRFDKVGSWTNYNPSNSGIAAYNVRTINATDTNELWFGTINGLSKKVGNTWTTYNTGNSPLPYDDVRDIKIDTTGDLWIGTYSGGGPTGGIAKYDGASWAVHDTSNSSLLANSVGTVLIDACDNVWCGNYYLNSMIDGTWTLFDTINSPLPSHSVTILFEDDAKRIWIGTGTAGIAVFDNDCGVLTGIVSQFVDHKNILFFPNPFSTQLLIRFPTNHSFTHCIISDLFGRELATLNAEGKNNLTWYSGNLPNGVYVVNAIGKYEINSYKVVKQ